MKEDKQKAIQFFASKGLDARALLKVQGKNPDFEIYLNGNFFAYSEVKSIIKYKWLGERHPPIWNSIQNKIHEARKQFSAVNPNHSHPNILMFLNHDSNYNWQDLYKVFNGKEPIPELLAYDTRHLKRLTRSGDIKEIDFIIWMDAFRDEKKPFQTVLAESKFKDQLKRQMR